MKKESLIKAKSLIIEVLSGSNIETSDKVELMLNLYLLLNEESYNEFVYTFANSQRDKKYQNILERRKYK